jgi:hypothetical protein
VLSLWPVQEEMVKTVELDAMTREQLIALARARKVALPPGRLSLPTLIKVLREAAVERKAAKKRRQ